MSCARSCAACGNRGDAREHRLRCKMFQLTRSACLPFAASSQISLVDLGENMKFGGEAPPRA